MKSSRLIGGKPKIGIRPIIDGRRGGIRESLEDMTMTMAHKVADLYSSVLRHSDGSPVECVIADTTIGGVAEAAMAAEKFRNNGVGVVLSVTPCWCYGFETIDMDGEMPKAIWGFNGTERPGAVYLASALASHTQKGLPAFGIYGRDVQEVTNTNIPEDVKEKLLRFARAGIAVATMKGKSYLSIGSVSMGIAGSIPNPEFFQEYLGMRNEYVDASEIERRVQLGIYDHEEFERAMAWTEKYCKSNEGTDFNPEHLVYSREEKDARWEYVVKMTLIFRDMMVGNPKLAEMGFKEESMGHNAIAAGFQGQRQWTDYKPDGDFSEAILNTSFDWNGIREAFTFATENDTLNCASMLFNHLLTNTAQIFADVRTYWSPNAVKNVTGKKLEGKAANGFIHLINSGSCTLDGTGCQTLEGKPVMKPFWEITEEEVEACLAATKWTVSLDEDVFKAINERTDRTWPSTFFAPRLTGKGYFRDVYTVMNNWGANHGAISYGHIGADLITLASMLRIPVCMHNVDEENIFRPSAWSAFGEDTEGSDYRACKNYGPLYK